MLHMLFRAVAGACALPIGGKCLCGAAEGPKFMPAKAPQTRVCLHPAGSLSRGLSGGGSLVGALTSAAPTHEWGIFQRSCARGMVCEKDVAYGALPGSLWEAILAEVDGTALVHLSCTSRELHHLASSSHVWRQVYQRDWGLDGVQGAAQSAASVLGTPARAVSTPAPSAALLQSAYCGTTSPFQQANQAQPLPAPATRQLNWKHLYKAKKETEANWQEGRCSQQLLRGHTDYLRCLDWQQAGARLVSASGSFAEKDCSIRVWDMRTGRCLERLVGHEGPIWSMQCDDESMVTSVGDDGTLRVWDLETHRMGVSRVLGPERVSCLSWDVAGGRLAAGNSDGSVAIWSVKGIQQTLQAAEDAAANLDSADDLSDCPSWQEVSLDAAGAPRLGAAPHPLGGPWPAITCMQLDGGLLVTGEGGGQGRVHLWDAAQLPGGSPCAPPTPWVGGTGPAEVASESEAGDAPRVTATLGPHGKGVSCLALWRDRSALAVGSVGGELKLWDMTRCEAAVQSLRGHKRDVLCMQLGGGADMATGSADKTLRVWDTRVGQCVRKLALPSIPYCIQLRGGRVAAGCSDGSVYVWDLRAGGGRGKVSPPLVMSGHGERVWALVMDESSLVSAGLDGCIIVRSFLPAHARFQGWTLPQCT